jgi:hypothetical protein
VTRWLVAVGLLLSFAACETFGAPNENPSRTVEGCEDAIKHLRSCCPRFNSYISCTYLSNAVAVPDLTASDSRCMAKRSCAEIERAIAAGDRVCGFLAPTKQCR